MRDRLLRPEIYSHYEEYLKILLADILIDVKNDTDLEDAREAAMFTVARKLILENRL